MTEELEADVSKAWLWWQKYHTAVIVVVLMCLLAYVMITSWASNNAVIDQYNACVNQLHHLNNLMGN